MDSLIRIAVIAISLAFSMNAAAYKNTFIYDPKSHSYKYYDKKGHLAKSGRASGGKYYCRDTGRRCKTPVGSFKISRKQGASCYSSSYRSAMPYCQFFSKYYAIHGHKHVPKGLASHGCIRVKHADARALYSMMGIGTRVIVRSY